MKPIEEFPNNFLRIQHFAIDTLYHHRNQIRIFETEILTFYFPLGYSLPVGLLNVKSFL